MICRGHDRGGARASACLCANIRAAPRTVAATAAAIAKRHRGDSNPCGQSPMDFESISLAARTQCHVIDHFLIGETTRPFKRLHLCQIPGAGSCDLPWPRSWTSKAERLSVRQHPCNTKNSSSSSSNSSSDSKTTPRGFEPLRAEPNGFRVHLLSRLDTVSCDR